MRARRSALAFSILLTSAAVLAGVLTGPALAANSSTSASPASTPASTAAATSSSAATSSPAPNSPAPRVQMAGGKLTLDGQPWWPTGVNAYELATNWNVNLGCGAMVDLDSFFASMAPRSLIRFDAYQAMAINKNTGKIDFSAIDAVFAAAARHNEVVLPVLSGQDGGCDNGRYKDYSFYQSGWQTVQNGGTSAPNLMSFADWVRTAVGRWASQSSLAGWELVGEPEDPQCGDAGCSWQKRTCPSDATTVLRSFMDKAGQLVRNIDANHPIFAGFLGGGQCGTAYTNLGTVAASANIDVIEYHDYGADGVALPGDQWNGLAERLGEARKLNKPLLVAEVGENAGSCESLSDRAAHISTKLTGQRQNGTAGLLVWDWVPDPRTDQCTYDVGAGDPVLQVMANATASS